MPRGDGTGPFGQGATIGRGAGYCARYAALGYANRRVFGRALGGLGAGGLSRGGRGRRNRFYATGVPLSAYGAGEPEALLSRDEEIALLKSESQRLSSVLETIDQRLAQIETA